MTDSVGGDKGSSNSGPYMPPVIYDAKRGGFYDTKDAHRLTDEELAEYRKKNPPQQLPGHFTPEQVKNLDEFQRSGAMHPFTCANRGDGKHFDNGVDTGMLIPTTRGWICQCCDYKQDWAHDFMLDGSAVKNSPLTAARSATEQKPIMEVDYWLAHQPYTVVPGGHRFYSGDTVRAAVRQAHLLSARAEEVAIYYERRPELDKRIKNGDDYAGDAWVRWTAVGEKPEGFVSRGPSSSK